MRAPAGAKTYRDFSGGVNVLDGVYNLQDNEARDARNIQTTTRGTLRKRAGTTTLATPAAALGSLYASEACQKLIGASGTKLQSISAAGAVVDLATGLTDAPWNFVTAAPRGSAPFNQGPIYGLNGHEPRSWDGTATTASSWTAAHGVLPLGKYLVAKSNRVLVAGMANGAYSISDDDKSTVVASDAGNPGEWPNAIDSVGGWSVTFDPFDGEAISGLGTIGPYVLVFKPSKTWVIYDLETGANRRIGAGIGCVSHRSIVETNEGTFFLSRDQGVCVSNGQSIKRVSDKLAPLINARAATADQDQLASAEVFGQHYLLSLPYTSGSANDLMLDYDIVAGSWWVHTLGMADMAVWAPTTGGQPRLYGANAASAKVSRLLDPAATQDNGSNISCYWNGPYLTFGTPEVRKRVRSIWVDAMGRARVSVQKDFAASATLLEDHAFSASIIDQARLPTPGVARAWSVIFANDTTDAMEIDSYIVNLSRRTD